MSLLKRRKNNIRIIPLLKEGAWTIFWHCVWRKGEQDSDMLKDLNLL
jgi:hypothetical protein